MGCDQSNGTGTTVPWYSWQGGKGGVGSDEGVLSLFCVWNMGKGGVPIPKSFSGENVFLSLLLRSAPFHAKPTKIGRNCRRRRLLLSQRQEEEEKGLKNIQKDYPFK